MYIHTCTCNTTVLVRLLYVLFQQYFYTDLYDSKCVLGTIYVLNWTYALVCGQAVCLCYFTLIQIVCVSVMCLCTLGDIHASDVYATSK